MIPNEDTAAICGLFCGTCPSYPDECKGCLSDKLTNDCVTCFNGFRECSKKHNIIRCYECSEFPCKKLKEFSKKHIVNGICHHEHVITNLNEMKEIGVGNWLKIQVEENTCEKCGKLIYWYDRNNHKCSLI